MGNEPMGRIFRCCRVLGACTSMAFACCLLAVRAEEIEPRPERSECAKCHAGIEPIREPGSRMMQEIQALGRQQGDPDGCVVCHGGDPKAKDKEAAHRGPEFYADPGSPWINEKTCGRCHERHVKTQWNYPMMTESGKIQGTSWSFGALEGYEHKWGNYDAENPADPSERVGTPEYRLYMELLKKLEPQAFPDRQEAIPEAPTDLAQVRDHPELAAFTYHRTECNRCHLGVRGRKKRGDYRGMGCSACHIPYSNEGFYEGNDKTIPKDEPGHLLVHSIQGTREAKVTVHGVTYSGIPVETCTTCHDRGKRIGVSYQGLMESAFHSPYTEGGGGQIALHTKHYIAMHQDIHYQKGMLCQDCHTSIDVHGDGFLAGANLAQVEIECSDCHGTPTAYPWELPLGFMDEFGDVPKRGPPRGVARSIDASLRQGTHYTGHDGFLLTARGNPFPDVVRKGNRVIVHTASGKDLELKPLKLLAQTSKLGLEAKVAMCQIDKHLDKMECYACHATWAPQCYGCHVKVDYSEGKKAFDWVAAGHKHAEPAHRADRDESTYDTLVPGKVEEQRSYMRWEDPALAINGEGRVSPAIPGCQPSITVIGPGGETWVKNQIMRSPAGTEGSDEEGQLCIDMSPAQPHTIGRARSCESCHLSPKALGYGIGRGRLTRPWDQPTIVDLETADKRVLPRIVRPQIEPIIGLEQDWSRFVTEDGRQTMTVGHHFRLSRPLNNRERANINRHGLCLSCHKEIPKESLAVSLLHHVAHVTGQLPTTHDEHASLIHKLFLFSAWSQVAAGCLAAVVFGAAVRWIIRRRRRDQRKRPPGGPLGWD